MDTNVAIYLRDRHPAIMARIALLDELPAMSILTRIELEGGVLRDPARARRRRTSLEEMIGETETIDFTTPMIAAYRQIIERLGYSRRQAMDRMIAATAITLGRTLITINGADFRDIPHLALEVWPDPAAQ